MANNKRLREVAKKTQFTSTNQPSNEAKSKGQINLSIEKNLIETLRTNIQDTQLVSKIVKGVNEEVESGNYKNGIELLKIAKENEKQVNENINLTPQIIVADDKHKSILEQLNNANLN